MTDTGRIATRAAIMVAETEHAGYRVTGWRVSQDIRDELARMVAVSFTGEVSHLPGFMRRPFLAGGKDSLLGAPLTMDPGLPPNSIIAVTTQDAADDAAEAEFLRPIGGGLG